MAFLTFLMSHMALIISIVNLGPLMETLGYPSNWVIVAQGKDLLLKANNAI
ncbi:hypothetical protein FOXB_13496 [Fusarium oxysporum f. sp. conglutinans Fo5176]|uniref:Uncharacterized protein n=1 Tax=Fusarium oxysporum (strain Fo5176) TaxID=660025 RepID=F9G4B4_FUSOF|nr:hypothetical protein FOXB_13496 [Fusarium oxysporum f. sp. conglutinans Fo5176]